MPNHEDALGFLREWLGRLDICPFSAACSLTELQANRPIGMRRSLLIRDADNVISRIRSEPKCSIIDRIALACVSKG